RHRVVGVLVPDDVRDQPGDVRGQAPDQRVAVGALAGGTLSRVRAESAAIAAGPADQRRGEEHTEQPRSRQDRPRRNRPKHDVHEFPRTAPARAPLSTICPPPFYSAEEAPSRGRPASASGQAGVSTRPVPAVFNRPSSTTTAPL